MGEVPEDRCGFEMLAADVSYVNVASSYSLSEAVKSCRVVVCWRETAEGSERCLWHTEGLDKSGAELPDVDNDGPVVLDGARLSGFNIQEGKSLSDVRMRFADLSGADLFRSDLSKTVLSRCDLSETVLSHSDLSEASLPGSNLSEAYLFEADLSETDLSRCDLSGAALDRADLPGSILNHANLSNADLRSADLSNTALRSADLSDADLHSADLSKVSLSGSDFSKADLTDTDMSGVQAANATLRNATLERADLSKADVFTADLTGAKLYGAILSDIRLNDATEFGDHYTDEDDSIEKATWTLRQVERISRESALPEQVTEAVVERKTRRRRHHWKEGDYLSWLRNAGFGLLTKYGESPSRVVLLSLLTILGGVVTFPCFGIRDTTSDGQILTYALQNTDILNLLGKSLYLSTATFTTVGYGDLQPVGLGQLLATVESFLGALLMALLVFVLGRRATR